MGTDTGVASNGHATQTDGAAAPQLVPVTPEMLAAALGAKQSAAPAQRPRGPLFWIPVSVLGVRAALGMIAGAFLLGQGTRDSAKRVDGKVAAASAATAKAG